MVTNSKSAKPSQGFDLLPLTQVIRLVAQADRREFTLFLGAGASKSSGVPLASDMIAEWRKMVFEDRAMLPDVHFKSWCENQPWYDKDDEYSILFEMLFPNPRARQKYVEPKIEAGFPGWCYLYLANIVKSGYFNVIFTTNFDDLINDALTMYLGYNAMVCAADSLVENISITSDRAKIVKLHGDYLFQHLKNTPEELKQLDPNMDHKFREFGKQCGMVVIGYAGRDQSVMRVIEEMINDKDSFPNGIYWGVRPQDNDKRRLAPRVQELARRYPKHFHLFQCPDFDLFMSRLHSALKLDLPRTVLHPHESVRERFNRLVENTMGGQQNDPMINAHRLKLEEELNRPWAKETDLDAFDLMQAQIALGQRDYKTALTLIVKYCQRRPDDANAVMTWGDALAVQGEEEASEAALEEAAVKWREAVRLNQRILAPRYRLARHYWRLQKYAESIIVLEELLKRVPKDHLSRRSLIVLYATSSRFEDALREIDVLLERQPNSDELHAMKAAVLEQRGLIDRALQEIRRAAELKPRNAQYHFALANILIRLGKLDEAAAEIRQATQLDPRNLSYRLQAVNFYSLQQRLDLALEHAEAAVRSEPTSAEARGWLGQIYFTLGRIMEAQREIEEALRLSPHDSRILADAGILYSNLNRFDLAERYFRQAAQSNPSRSLPYYMLCMIYWVNNRWQEFNGAYQQLMRVAPPIAQQLQMQLQMMDQQFMGNRLAAFQALQRQNAPWLQNQSQQAQQQQPWIPPQPNRRS
ncbi:MAG TPA: tetratricopeptide repeat protein [Pyrinomonadaceae bacterium]